MKVTLGSYDQFLKWAQESGHVANSALPDHVTVVFPTKGRPLPDGIPDPPKKESMFRSPVVQPAIAVFPVNFTGMKYRSPSEALKAFFLNTAEGKRLLEPAKPTDLAVPSAMDFIITIAHHGPQMIPELHVFFQGVDWERRQVMAWKDTQEASRGAYLQEYATVLSVTRDKGAAHDRAQKAYDRKLEEEWGSRMQQAASDFTKFWEARFAKATKTDQPLGLPWWQCRSRVDRKKQG